jgi:excisionase family DNA binding protein
MRRNDHQSHRKYNITQAARRLGMSVIALRRVVLRGEITHYRPFGEGRKIMFSEEALREYELRHTRPSQSPGGNSGNGEGETI